MITQWDNSKISVLKFNKSTGVVVYDNAKEHAIGLFKEDGIEGTLHESQVERMDSSFW